MLGLMQDWPLLCHRIIEHAAKYHGTQEVITRSVEGPIHRTNYAEIHARALKVSQRLERDGIKLGDRVATIAWNTWRHLEVWYGIMGIGAICHTVNPRLFPEQIAWIINHAQDRVVMTDITFVPVLEKIAGDLPSVERYIVLTDRAHMPQTTLKNAVAYEDWIAEADGKFEWKNFDENTAAAMCYTSGTTGDPKGVVYHHRGAYLLAVGNVITCGMGKHPVYLWTLPMFHCNGWCFPWTLSIVAGTHVCLRAVRAAPIFNAIADHKVTHLCGAPIVMSTLLNAPAEEKKPLPHLVQFATAAAPPPEAVLAAMKDAGFNVTHLYGLTETYGPASINEWHGEREALGPPDQAAKKARQGVRYPTLEGLDVLDPETMQPVPRDGSTLGEVMFRGNVVMKGYLKNKVASEKAFSGGWFHSGDLGVVHPDGYIQLKDRSKDIIISGGENISSIEVEDALLKHPSVLHAAVVARPDEKWGETPCAFVERKKGHNKTTERELVAWCRDMLAHYKCPRHIVFCELPKTSTGKIQKFKLRERAKGVE